MPSTGTPAPSSSGGPGGSGGAPSEYTDAGPPDKMMALGLRASISVTGMVAGTISEYTWHSRTRRAISCAYWAPKSTTRTVSKSGLGCTPPPSPRNRQSNVQLAAARPASRPPGPVPPRGAQDPPRGAQAAS